MKKKFLLVGIILSLLLVVSGCASAEGKAFKEEYESINGQENASGKIHRTISIPEDNPFVKVESSKIVEMMDNKETFYVYFGDPLCPWCRSVLEKAIEVAKDNNIKKIYYVKIWDESGNEVVRDKYKLDDNNNPELVSEGDSSYKDLLTKFDSVLSEYNLTTADGEKVSTGEKRIYAPNFMYVENGKAIRLTEGISESQTDSRGELTKEILEDEEKQFKEFFK